MTEPPRVCELCCATRLKLDPDGEYRGPTLDMGNGPVEVCPACKTEFGPEFARLMGRPEAPRERAAWVDIAQRRRHKGPTLSDFT